MAILNTGLPTNITEYPNSFKRQGAFPLERYSVFYSLNDAQDYAKENSLAYVGQYLVVVENNAATLYVIDNIAGYLKKVGFEAAYDATNKTLKLF